MLVYGYHGTTAEAAFDMCRMVFKCQYKDHHWVGQGLYFFQDAPSRAWKWAEQEVKDVRQGHSEPAVVRAIIDLDLWLCIDLLDTNWFLSLKKAYLRHLEKYSQIPPKQTSIKDLLEKTGRVTGGPHRLDCDVIDAVIQELEEENVTIQAVRAAFIEGEELIATSHLYDLAHVQIAVREKYISIIKECVRVPKPGARGTK
jgi:hypothetical protein